MVTARSSQIRALVEEIVSCVDEDQNFEVR